MLHRKLLKMAIGTVPTARFRSGVTERELISKESKIGRTMFGPIPRGHQREFFCLDEHTWIWYESWTDKATSRRMERTTRYEIHPNCVLKIQDGEPYKEVTGEELYNLVLATRQYFATVADKVYGRPLAEA